MRTFRLSPRAPVVLAAALIALPAGLSAASAAQGSDSGDAAPVCLLREGTDGKPLLIIVPAAAKKGMSDKGFVQEPCSQNFATLVAREGYRDAVCHMASTYREDQIAVFERRYGERPGVLCGMAEVAISEWNLRD